MLVISQKKGEQFRIGRDITITVVAVQGGKVRLGIEAPPELVIKREKKSYARSLSISGPSYEQSHSYNYGSSSSKHRYAHNEADDLGQDEDDGFSQDEDQGYDSEYDSEYDSDSDDAASYAQDHAASDLAEYAVSDLADHDAAATAANARNNADTASKHVAAGKYVAAAAEVDDEDEVVNRAKRKR